MLAGLRQEFVPDAEDVVALRLRVVGIVQTTAGTNKSPVHTCRDNEQA